MRACGSAALQPSMPAVPVGSVAFNPSSPQPFLCGGASVQLDGSGAVVGVDGVAGGPWADDTHPLGRLHYVTHSEAVREKCVIGTTVQGALHTALLRRHREWAWGRVAMTGELVPSLSSSIQICYVASKPPVNVILLSC